MDTSCEFTSNSTNLPRFLCDDSFSKCCLVSRDSIRCFYTNAQSLPNKLPELYDALITYKPSLIGLTETWLSNDTSDSEISLPNMSVLRVNRNSNGGGVALYFSSHFSVYKLRDCFNSSDSLWCAFSLTNNDVCLLAVIYRPPNNTSDADALLLEYLERF